MTKTKRPVGRQTKLTPKVHERIVTAIRAGNYARIAAAYAGIGERTFYQWMQRGREEDTGIYRQFAHAVKAAESQAEVRAVAMVQKQMDSNWQAAMTYLERKFPHRWGRRDRLSVDVAPGEALAGLLGMGDDELEAAVDAAARKQDGVER